MKKSIFFCAALFACALGFQSCDKVDNPSGEPLEPTKAVIDNGTELADAVKNFAKEGVLEVPSSVVELNVSESIDLSEIEVKAENLTLLAAKGIEIKIGKPMTNVSIIGDATKPATIIAKEGFVSNGSIAIMNVNIDFTEEANASLITIKDVIGKKALKADGTDSPYTILDLIDIEGVKVSGLKKSLIESTAGKILFTKINVINSIVEVCGNVNVFALGGGFPENLLIEESTIWSNGVHKNFFFKADGKPADVTTETTTTWTVNQSTLVNIAIGKKANNSNGGIKGKKTTIMNLKNSILYNFGSNKGNEVNGWLWGQNGGAIANYENNTYWSEDGAVEGWTDSGKGGSDQTETALTTDPAFTDAANGIFKPAGDEQVAKKTGDPRWYNAN